MKAEDVKIEAGWKEVLRPEFESAYFDDLKMDLKRRIQDGAKVLPPGGLIFNAFNTTPWDKVKVVILGQDPYHRVGQAMGLSFSVPKGVRIPPSLKNIYKEIILVLHVGSVPTTSPTMLPHIDRDARGKQFDYTP